MVSVDLLYGGSDGDSFFGLSKAEWLAAGPELYTLRLFRSSCSIITIDDELKCLVPGFC